MLLKSNAYFFLLEYSLTTLPAAREKHGTTTDLLRKVWLLLFFAVILPPVEPAANRTRLGTDLATAHERSLDITSLYNHRILLRFLLLQV